MPIEFRCSQCGRLLRTGDETSGRQAQCPACGGLSTIPRPAAATGTPVPGLAPLEAGSTLPAGPPAPAGPSLPPAAIAPTALDASHVFGRTWSIFQEQWAMCLVVMLMIVAISIAVGLAVGFGSATIGALTRSHAVFQALSILGNVTSWVFGIWLGIGQGLFFLRIARGQVAEIGDVFAGGPYFWKILGATILFGLAAAGATFACVFPLLLVGDMLLQQSRELAIGLIAVGAIAGVVAWTYVILTFSQFYYLILDRNMGVMESFTWSQRLMAGNKLTLFLIWLVTMLVGGLLILLTCGLGILAVAPFAALMAPVIYLAVSGQHTAGQSRSQQGG